MSDFVVIERTAVVSSVRAEKFSAPVAAVTDILLGAVVAVVEGQGGGDGHRYVVFDEDGNIKFNPVKEA